MSWLQACLILLAVLPLAAAAGLWRWLVWAPGRRPRRTAAELRPADPTRIADLRRDLVELAETIGPRNLSRRPEQLLDAARFLERRLESYGYRIERQTFTVDGREVWNVQAQRTGTRRPGEVLLVGAHYDTVPGSPGANDNGSAVVANLALARALAPAELERTVRFVFFVNEEAPYYMTPAMGSLRCAQACRDNNENLLGMISLETIGCYSDQPDSQRYPHRVLGLLYPRRGNFIAVVGNIRSRAFVHALVRGLRQAAFPAEGIAAPGFLKDIFRSDHAAFWQCGYPAVMITDTANFRYRYYHTPEDTVDKIHFDALATLVESLETALRSLLGGARKTPCFNKSSVC